MGQVIQLREPTAKNEGRSTIGVWVSAAIIFGIISMLWFLFLRALGI